MKKEVENTSSATLQIPKEVVEANKVKYGDKLRILELPKDDDYEEILEVLAIVPNRSVVAQFQRFKNQDPKKAQEILVKQCLLTSKDEVIADDGLFYATVIALSELIPIREGKSRRL